MNDNNNAKNQKDVKETNNQESKGDNQANNDNNFSDKESEEDSEIKELNRVFPKTDGRLSSKKMEQTITLDTVVYEISGFGESRIKDYGKISAEIKQVEQMAKIEKAKLKKKIMQMNKRLNDTKEANTHSVNPEENNDENVQNKLLNLQSKKLMMMEFERDKKFNFIEVIQKLKILPEKRTIRDILRIKTYINQSKLGINFKDEFTDLSIVDKLINFCCIEMRYMKVKKGETILKIGDSPDFFYSIIFGKVNILKPISKTVSLTGFQYFKYLMKMRKKKENYIINLCLKNNKSNFVIEPEHGEIIHYIYLLLYLKYIRSNGEPQIEFDKILDLLDIKPEDLGIDQKLINSNYYINDNMKQILKAIPHISQDIIDHYSFINNYSVKRDVIIYEYTPFLSLQTNDYFGDLAIESNRPRNTTVIAEEDTDIAYLSNKLYSTQIATEKAIILQNKITNLHRSNFFHKIKFYKFSKKYYSWFINEKHSKGDILFNEGEDIKYLYFIEDGSVELSINRSMYEIDSLISVLESKKKLLDRNTYIDLNLSALNKSANEEEYINKHNNIYNYSPITSTFDDIYNHLNQKHNCKVMILNSKEDIGIVSYLLGNHYLCTCQIVSKYAKIYRIDIDYLNQMLESENEIKWEFFRRLKSKMELLSKRLFKINNIKLVMTDEKIAQNKLNNKTVVEVSEEIPTNNALNNSFIDYEKINTLFNKPKDYNSSIYNTNDSLMINNESIRYKNENIELPMLYNNKIKNHGSFSLTTSNTIHDLKNINKSTMNKDLKFNNLKLYNIMQEKPKKIMLKKSLIEDNILYKIKKDIRNISENKYFLSRDKICVSRNKKENKNLLFNSDKKKDKIYLTDLTCNNNNSKIINNPENNETEKNNLNFNTIKFNKASLFIKGFDQIPQSFETTINNETSGNIKSLGLIKNIRSLSNDYQRFNTENNDGAKKSKNSLYKRHNHPYYDPLTLIKKAKYKIFENKDMTDKMQTEYLNTHLERVRQLKKLRSDLRNNFKNQINIHNKNNKVK
jgi:CRP-like cAMP-binding protein